MMSVITVRVGIGELDEVNELCQENGVVGAYSSRDRQKCRAKILTRQRANIHPMYMISI
jgi:hypothetical protein